MDTRLLSTLLSLPRMATQCISLTLVSFTRHCKIYVPRKPVAPVRTFADDNSVFGDIARWVGSQYFLNSKVSTFNTYQLFPCLLSTYER
ncbi:hypothetical protein F5B19DRAFT_471658 [Rostrohypoxylon terebratum]|nr:hypothetical protein F5B19DRAFT_471658 [Rostrohypoxylon terebratum]